MRIALLLIPLAACAADDPSVSTVSYRDSLPDHFDGALARGNDNTPADNPITDEGASLGRLLFYDPNLSVDGTIACASCHQQEHGFADTAMFSTGVAGETARNTMSIVDARFYRNGRMFWDERAATLEEQVLMPVQNPVEMGLTLDELVANVSADPQYPAMFEAAFGDDEITSDRIARALAQFVRAAISYRTRFDEGMEATGDVNAPFPEYTAEENRGKDIFLRGCAGCHMDSGPVPPGGARQNQAVFYIDVATNNGLVDEDDEGAGGGRFKSPSLRNVALTAPYMHDGRFATLEEVVDHYADDIQPTPNLDPRLQGPRPPLGVADRAALVAFLRTLTDDELVKDARFSAP